MQFITVLVFCMLVDIIALGEITSTVNLEIIACNYYCDFVILDLNAILIFTILRNILFNSYKIFQNASLNYCVYTSVAFLAIIKTSQ